MAQNLLVRSLITIFLFLRMVCTWVLLLIPHERARVLTRFIFGTPFYLVTISLDRWLFPTGKRHNPFIPFPRDTFEVVSRGEELFELVKEYQKMRREKNLPARNYSAVGFKTIAGNDEEAASFTPLRGPIVIPDDAEFVSLTRSGETDEFIKETLKKVQVGFFTLKFKSKSNNRSKNGTTTDTTTTTTTLDLFIKTPSQRSLGRLIQGMGSAMNERQNEQRFYEDVFPRTNPEDSNIAYVYASFYSRLFQHTCIVAEKVDTTVWKSTTDAEGMSEDQAEALVKASARFHAQFWAPPRDDKKDKCGLQAYPERSGLAWLDGGMSLFFTDDKKICPDWMASLWPTLCRFYDKSMTAGSHGDCRPGNMLFSGRFNNNTQKPQVEVLMTDWEACNICPISYDFCYSLLCGFPSYQRRGQMRRLWKLHIESLLSALEKHQGKKVAADVATTINGPLSSDDGFHECKLDNSKFKMETMMDRLELEVDIFPIAVAYFGWLLTRTGGVGDTQGNLEGDCNAWGDRLRTAILDTLLIDDPNDESSTGAGTPSAPHNDGYETWTDSHYVSGKTECHTKEEKTMEDFGHIFIKKGNLWPMPEEGAEASHDSRCRIAEDGTVMGKTDRPYNKMYLNERIIHFLEPYHVEGRKTHPTMQGMEKKNPSKYNRTVRQDLMDLASDISRMGMEERVKKAGY